MSNNLVKAREKCNYTQSQLSEISGVSRTYISNLENDKYEPTRKIMRLLANALNESVENIFFTNQ